MKEFWTRGDDLLGITEYHNFGSSLPYSRIFFCIRCGSVYGARTVEATETLFISQGGRCLDHADARHPSTLIPDICAPREILQMPPGVLALFIEESTDVYPDSDPEA